MLIWLAVEVTEWDIPDVGCCKLIGKEDAGVSECCVLLLEARASL